MRYVVFGFFGASIGVAIGIVGGLLLPPLFYKFTNPEILKDGQWGMIYLASLPVGAGIGAPSGCLTGVFAASKIRK